MRMGNAIYFRLNNPLHINAAEHINSGLKPFKDAIPNQAPDHVSFGPCKHIHSKSGSGTYQFSGSNFFQTCPVPDRAAEHVKMGSGTCQSQIFQRRSFHIGKPNISMSGQSLRKMSIPRSGSGTYQFQMEQYFSLYHPLVSQMPYIVAGKRQPLDRPSMHFVAMHNTSFNLIAYVLAEVICCLVLFDCLHYWYQNVLKLRLIDSPLFNWHCASNFAWGKLTLELFRFFPGQILVIVLITLSEKQSPKPPEVSHQATVWLLGVTLWNALGIEVCKVMTLGGVC